MEASPALPDLSPDPVWPGLQSCLEVANPERRVLDVSGFSRTSIRICFHLRCICAPQIFMVQGSLPGLGSVSSCCHHNATLERELNPGRVHEDARTRTRARGRATTRPLGCGLEVGRYHSNPSFSHSLAEPVDKYLACLLFNGIHACE